MMMQHDLRTALTGLVSGAAAAIAILIAATASGLVPTGSTDARIHDYLLANPQVLVAMSQKLHAQEDRADDDARQAAVARLGAKAFFDPRVAFLAGPARARTTFVEFFDYNCPYCRASIATVRKYYDAHRNDTRFAFIEFPIKGRQSVIAARATIAARKQPGRYLDFHFRLMGEKALITEDVVYADAKAAGLDVEKLKNDMRDSSVDMTISAAHALAAASNIDGTPAFIVNGRMLEGALDTTRLAGLLKGS
jgi:protein-disulfide isomerase